MKFTTQKISYPTNTKTSRNNNNKDLNQLKTLNQKNNNNSNIFPITH